MKKGIIKGIAVVLATVIAVLGVYIAPPANGDVRHTAVYATSINMVKDPAVNYDEPGTRERHFFYTESGKKIFKREIAGGISILAAEDGTPLANRSTSAIITYDENSETYIDGATNTLQIYLDSSGNYRLANGTFQIIEVPQMHENLYLIATSEPNKVNGTVWATRKEVKDNWHLINNPFGNKTHFEYYYAVGGGLIADKWIVQYKNSPWYKWAIEAVLLTQPLLTVNILKNWFEGNKISYVEIQRTTTFAACMTEMSGETYHPWGRLVNEQGVQLKTENNEKIYVNPKNSQLTDYLGNPLFSQNHDGVPLCIYQNIIIALDKNYTEQNAVNGVLVGAVSILQMINNNIELYTLLYTVPFGVYDFPMRNIATGEDRRENPVFETLMGVRANNLKLPAGGRIEDVTIGGQNGKTAWETFRDWFNKVFSILPNPIKGLKNLVWNIFCFLVVAFACILIIVLMLKCVKKVFTGGGGKKWKRSKWKRR